jgi:hypothetical protein
VSKRDNKVAAAEFRELVGMEFDEFTRQASINGQDASCAQQGRRAARYNSRPSLTNGSYSTGEQPNVRNAAKYALSHLDGRLDGFLETSVDIVDTSGDIRSALGREKCYQSGYFVGIADAFKGNELISDGPVNLFPCGTENTNRGVTQPRAKVGMDESGTHAIHQDIISRKFYRESLRERKHPCLGSDVVHDQVRKWCMRRNSRDVYNATAPLLAHQGRHFAAEPDSAVEVDLHAVSPLVISCVHGMSQPRITRIVYQDIDLTELAAGSLDDSLYVFEDCDVGFYRHCGDAMFGQDRCRLMQILLAAGAD